MKRKRILVVDDEVAFTRLLKLNLEQTDRYEVAIANWAEDALPLAREFRPDLVLLDVVMPRMVGGDVAAHLRADRCLRETPIVFISGAVSRWRIKEHGGVVNGYPVLVKPASAEEVIEVIERQLPELSDAEAPTVPAFSAEDGQDKLQQPAEKREPALALAAAVA